MAYLAFNNVRIASLCCVVPENIQTIFSGDYKPGENYQKNFIKRMGVSQRHISLTEQTCTDTGYQAAVNALKKACWNAEDLDGVVFLSQTPDFNNSTGNAFIVHNRLNMRKDAFAFDIPLGCSSFPYGLSVASSMLQQPQINKILIVSGDTRWSEFRSKEELLNAPLFLNGEASVATLLEKKDYSYTQIELYSDGKGYKYLYDPRSGSRNHWRTYPGYMSNGLPAGGPYMDGMEITSFATTTVVDSIKNFLIETKQDINDFDGVVLHQANLQIVKTIAKRLNVPLEKVPVSLDKYANTDGASPLVTIADAYHNYDKKELKLLLCAFGVGLSWGVASFNIETDVIGGIELLSEGQFSEGFISSEPIN